MISRAGVMCAVLGVVASLSCGGAKMQPLPSTAAVTGYKQTNLVADTVGTAVHTDPQLVNPWGVAFAPGQPFFIANNARGSIKVIDPSGAGALPLGFGIPTPVGATPPARPAGVVFNPIAEDFTIRGTPAQFVFATEEGTLSTWANVGGDSPMLALLAHDASADGAVYKGIAILSPTCCREYLAVTDFHGGFISTFDISFNFLSIPGPFKDNDLPPGFAPFNIQKIGDQVFVTFALQDSLATNPVVGQGNGIVDIFDQEGNFVRRFASNGPLNAPWGITRASNDFGPFSNAILIGNFGDGVINAFDPAGKFLGAMRDAAGNVITNPGLWALTFRPDGVGEANTLYFTSGRLGENHGLFGAISPAPRR
jgi:uncharacterized protein (TIGR03118 family)